MSRLWRSFLALRRERPSAVDFSLTHFLVVVTMSVAFIAYRYFIGLVLSIPLVLVTGAALLNVIRSGDEGLRSALRTICRFGRAARS